MTDNHKTGNQGAQMTPTLVLTRPDAQSRALAKALGAQIDGPIRIVVSPILEIVCTDVAPDLDGMAGIILTSVHAVHCGPPLAGLAVHCVGERTAEVAREAGAVIRTVAPDAARLVPAIPGPGPLLHLRGAHARGAVARRLTEAGIETGEAVVYAQRALHLTPEARGLIEAGAPTVLPLFSPRSAALVGDKVKPGAGLRVIALSPAVAEAWGAATGGEAESCDEPTRDEMHERIVAALRRKLP